MSTTVDRYKAWKEAKKQADVSESAKAATSIPETSVVKPATVEERLEQWRIEKSAPKSAPVKEREIPSVRAPLPTEIWNEKYTTPARSAPSASVPVQPRTSDDVMAEIKALSSKINRAYGAPNPADVKRIEELENEYASMPKKPLGITAGNVASGFFEGGFDQLMSGAYGAVGAVDERTSELHAQANKLPSSVRDLVRPYDYKPVKSSAYDASADFKQAAEQNLLENTENANAVGKKIVELSQSAGNMVASAGFVPGFAGPAMLPQNIGLSTLGVSAGGSAAAEARASGASASTALVYGVLSGATEVVTEKLFGGNPLFDKSAGLVNRLIAKIPNSGKLVSFLASKPVEVLNEGLEEMIAEIMGPVYQRLTYDPKADFATLEQILEAGIDGVLLSGIMQGGATLGNAAQRIVTRPSAPQTTDDIVAEIMAENYANAPTEKNLQLASPTFAQDGRVDDLQQTASVKDTAQKSEKKAIPADALINLIKTMGDDGAKAFRTAFEPGAENLADKYGAWVRYYEGGAANRDFATTDKVNAEYGKLIGDDIKQAAYNSGLADRNASLKAETEKVQYATMQGKESGFIQTEDSKSIPKETAKVLNDIGKAVGVKIVMRQSIAGGRANGLYNNGVIEIANDAQNPVLVVATHEVTHRMQELAPEAYRAFRDYAVSLQADGSTTLAEQYRMRYASDDVNITTEQAMDEIAADFAMKAFSDEAQLKRFIKDADRNVVQKFFDAVRAFIDKVKAALTGKAQNAVLREYGITMSQLEKAERLYRDAFKVAKETAQGKEQAGASAKAYSLKNVTLTQNDIEKNISVVANMHEVVKLTGDEFPKGSVNLVDQVNSFFESYNFSVKNEDLGDIEITRRGIKDSMSHGIGRKKSAAFAAVPSVLENGKIIDFQRNWKNRGYDTVVVAAPIVIDGERYYEGVVVLRESENQRFYLHEVFLEKMKRTESPFWTGTVENNGKPGGESNPSLMSLLQKVQNVNSGTEDSAKYSLKDSTGRTLTPEQAEFFKDSKVRDKNGNLLVVYHGGTVENIFDTNRGDVTEYGKGSYFTPSEYYAKDWAKERGGSVKPYYLNIEKMFDDRSDIPASAERDALEKLLRDHGFTDREIKTAFEWGFKRIARILENHGHKSEHSILGRPHMANELIREAGYDGIIGELYDGVQYVAFNPEQIKSADNKNPTSDPDIRYSLKGTDDLAKQNTRLAKQNEFLKEQMKLSKGYKVDAKAAQQIAREIVKNYSANMPAKDVAGAITELYNFIGNGKDAVGNVLTFEALKEKATDISKAILESAEALNTDAWREYKDMREYLRTTRMKVNDADKGSFPESFNEFRKHNYGRLRLSNEGIPVDEIYQELAEMYPGFFDPEIQTNQVDQLLRIEEVLDSLKPVYENPYGSNLDEAAVRLANQMIAAYYDVPAAKPTYADRQKQKLLNEKAKRFNLAEADRQKIEQIKDENRQYIQRILKRERERRAEREQSIKNRYEAKESRSKEQQQSREIRAKIRRQIKELTTTLAQPTDTRHIPSALKFPVSAFLNGVDMSHVDNVVIKNIDDLDDMSTAYDDLMKSESAAEYIDLDPDFFDNIKELKQTRGKKLKDFSVSELETLYHVVLAVRRSATMYNATLAGEQRHIISELGETVMLDLATDTGYVERAWWIMRWGADMLNMNMLDSFAYFEELGPTMEALFVEIRNGMDTKIRNTKVAADYMQDLIKGIDIKPWTDKKASMKTFKRSTGDSIDLTPAQVMSLYLLHRQQKAHDHIYVGGIKQAPTVTKGKKGYEVKRSFKPAKVTFKDIMTIIKSMTPEQRKVADGIGKFFTDTTAQWGNEVSEKLYGYKKFTEENYFPIVSDGNYVNVAFAEVSDKTLRNMGVTKSRIKGANNPVIIEDVFDVYTRQADQMGSYNAFVLPLSDMQKVYNFKNPNGDGSVKEAIEKKFGSRAQRYFRDLMTDINGGIRVDVGSEAHRKLISNYKGAAMGLNFGVVLQQPTSYLRAAAIIDTKYLAKAVTAKGDWEKVKKYSPIAQWKDWGYFTLDVGRQMKGVFLNEKNITDKTMWLIGQADNLTWTRIWNAVELETKDRFPDIRIGSQEFYDRVAIRFREIIDRTQVVDTVLHRTAILRSKNDLTKMATSFMSEPMKQYNLLRSTIRKALIEKTQAANDRAKRAITSTIGAFLVNEIVRTLIQMYRTPDDKEDRAFWERFLQMYGSNVVSDVFGTIPYVRDIASTVQGFDVGRMDMEGFSSLSIGLKKAWNVTSSLFTGEKPSYTAYDALKGVLRGVGMLTGVPVTNALREIESALTISFRWTNAFEQEFVIAKLMYSPENNSQVGKFYDVLARAKKAGDDEAYAWILSDLRRMGVKVESIGNAVGNRYGSNPIAGMKEAVRSGDRTAFDYAATGEYKASGGKELRDDDYERYMTDRAAIAYDVVSDIISSMDFNGLDAEAQSKALKNALDYASDVAESKYTDDKLEGWVKTASDLSKVVDPGDYILFNRRATEAASDGISSEEIERILDEMDLSRKEREALYGSRYKKNNPYD